MTRGTSRADVRAAEAWLRVAGDGRIDAGSRGPVHWRLSRRPPAVALLGSPLLGLGAGESLATRIDLEAGASAIVTGQGPTALLAGEPGSTQCTRITVGRDAHLTLLPRHVVPYAGSRAVLDTLVDLAPGATLAAWDVLATGRTGAGEDLLLAALRSTWTLRREGEVLLRDRLHLDGARRAQTAAMLAGRTHLGTLVLAGLDEDALPVAVVRSALEATLDLAGASRPAADLVVVRALAASVERLETALLPVVTMARAAAGQPLVAPHDIGRRHVAPTTTTIMEAIA
jgi:urease accessory protein UreH